MSIPVQRSSRLSPWSLDRRGWIAALRQVWREMDDDHLDLVAGGVAFFGFLALFPALAAFIAAYGLLSDPAEVARLVEQLRGVVPPAVLDVVAEQLQRLTATANASLSWSAVVALVLALWSASKGARGVVEAINVAYDQVEQRGIVERYLVGLGLTVGSIVFVVLALALVAGVPAVLAFAGLDVDASQWLRWARWPVLLLLLLVAVAAVYYVAPDRKSPRWQWLTPGSTLATLGLLAASGLFSLYVTSFGDYNEVYGSVGAVAVFLLWLYLASFVVLVGAELNAAVEHQVAQAAASPRGNPDAPRPGEVHEDTTRVVLHRTGDGEDASEGALDRARDGDEQEHDHEQPER